MRFLGRVLFIVPLAVHIGYFAATFDELARTVGRTGNEAGTPRGDFAIFWILTIGLANLAFTALHLRLPRMKESTLKVPGQEYWLSTPERRADLVSRLRGIFEAALLGLNIFFFAVYQSIYQANAHAPAVRFELPTLITFFMIAPLLMVVVAAVLITRGIALDATREKE